MPPQANPRPLRQALPTLMGKALIAALSEVRIRYQPHPIQEQFHDSGTRFRALIGGIGSGKTLAGVQEAIRTAVLYPGSVGLLVAPTYRMLYDATVRTFFSGSGLAEGCPADLIKEQDKGEEKVKLVNGSEIWFRSGDNPDRLRGPNIGWFHGDEAALWDHDTWRVLLGRLRERPGRAWVTTTPKGRNWVWEEWVAAPREEYAYWVCPTVANTYLDAGFLKAVQDSYAGDWARQELEGVFLEATASAFRNVSGCVHGELGPPRQGRRYVAAWDPAKTSDFNVVLVADAATRRVVHYDRWRMTDWTVSKARVQKVCEDYNGAYLWMDSTGVGDPLLEDMVEARVKVEGFLFTAVEKARVIQQLALALERETIRYPRIDELIRELEVFTPTVTKAGNIRYEAQSSYHDDCVIALALLVEGLEHEPSRARPAVGRVMVLTGGDTWGHQRRTHRR